MRSNPVRRPELDLTGTRARVPLVNRMVLGLLGSPLRLLLDHAVGALRYTARTGVVVTFPVQVARAEQAVVILAADAEKKRWWRHFRTPASVDVRLDGQWYTGTGVVVLGAKSAAAEAYRIAYPHVALDDNAVDVEVSFPEPLPASVPLRGRDLSRLWFPAVTIAEFVGFSVPAVVGALTISAPAPAAVVSLVAAGAVEGMVLGSGQTAVLRRALPGLPRRRWVLATGAAAATAYVIGLAPSTYGAELSKLPAAVLALVATLLGAALLGSIEGSCPKPCGAA
jgi:hypothetical protein